MAGIYIHIPFCKRICYYCNFYFSLTLKNKNEIVESICKELQIRSKVFKHTIDTIYFGGGTPSVLSLADIERITYFVYNYYSVSDKVEFSFEANPDDLTKEYISDLKHTKINRLSIGIQSFFDDDLVLMNRRHTAKEALNSLERCFDAGFTNITADLMYGLPNFTNDKLNHNISTLLAYPINHVSAYHLSIEPQTAFNKFVKTGKIKIPSENASISQFEFLIEILKNEGFVQYEISNFARNNNYSIHNTNYWQQVPYLGVGPSAHSYFNNKRYWNIANNREYIFSINDNKIPYEEEEITRENRFNEYIFTRLRTMWGLDIAYMESTFNDFFVSIKLIIESYRKENYLVIDNNFIVLTESGKFIADKIASDLFIVDSM